MKGLKGGRTLKIFNSGRATARNIRVEGLEIDGIFYVNREIFPYELMNPQDNAELVLNVTYGSPSTIKLKYIWDDEFGCDNEFEQVLTL